MHPNRTATQWLIAGIGGFAVYFAVALYLKTYTTESAPAGTVMELKRPFFSASGFAWQGRAPELEAQSDSMEDADRSRFVIYEDEKPLGPPHSLRGKIAELGHGRFVHWRGAGFIFSSSDGTSPDSNGRKYRVVVPPESPPPIGMVAQLKAPFHEFQAGGLDYAVAAPGLDDLADTNDNAKRSPFVVYEDDRALGPAHSRASDIHELGHGQFLHWKGIGFIISSSDGSNPATNGHKYWVVLPSDAATK